MFGVETTLFHQICTSHHEGQNHQPRRCVHSVLPPYFNFHIIVCPQRWSSCLSSKFLGMPRLYPLSNFPTHFNYFASPQQTKTNIRQGHIEMNRCSYCCRVLLFLPLSENRDTDLPYPSTLMISTSFELCFWPGMDFHCAIINITTFIRPSFHIPQCLSIDVSDLHMLSPNHTGNIINMFPPSRVQAESRNPDLIRVRPEHSILSMAAWRQQRLLSPPRATAEPQGGSCI